VTRYSARDQIVHTWLWTRERTATISLIHYNLARYEGDYLDGNRLPFIGGEGNLFRGGRCFLYAGDWPGWGNVKELAVLVDGDDVRREIYDFHSFFLSLLHSFFILSLLCADIGGMSKALPGEG
jgi:hypothetical protein